MSTSWIASHLLLLFSKLSGFAYLFLKFSVISFKFSGLGFSTFLHYKYKQKSEFFSYDIEMLITSKLLFMIEAVIIF